MPFGGERVKARVLDVAPNLSEYSPSKVVSMGNVTSVTTFHKKPPAPPARKLNKDQYIDTRTGEIKEYDHIENRSECKDSIRHTLAWIRALINTNVTLPQNCRWVTLTYKENMMDAKQLYEDYVKFWKRFCRWCSKGGYGKPEYISVIEPQGRGAWHIHAFFIWDSIAPYISNNDVMAVLWGHGFTSTKQVSNCDNIGAYFSAYLADMPLEDAERLPADERAKAMTAGEVLVKEFQDEQKTIIEKKFIKGGRLYLYPPGMNIIRRSKGIKNPEVEWMTQKRAKEKVSRAKLTFSRAYEIIGDEGLALNTITKEYYNDKRA